MRLLKPSQIQLFIVLTLAAIIFILFSSLYETNINVEQLVSQRISVVILIKDGQRNTNSLQHLFPQARISKGNNISRALDNSKEISPVEYIYKEKYIQELEYFIENGKTMMVMLLEDDVIPVYTNKTLWYHLAINTIPLFSNDLANYDCSKRGFLTTTGFSDNKSLCRIFSKENLRPQINCLRSIPDAIDISIGYCQQQLDIDQKRFLAFVHSGMPSLIGHYNIGF